MTPEDIILTKFLYFIIFSVLFLSIGTSTGRRKRRQTNDRTSIISDIEKEVGRKTFSKLLAIDGEVTLAFVIDTTGSMSQEIEGVKQMVKDIISYQSKKLSTMDYILSPFNDKGGQKY